MFPIKMYSFLDPSLENEICIHNIYLFLKQQYNAGLLLRQKYSCDVKKGTFKAVKRIRLTKLIVVTRADVLQSL